MKTKKVDVVPYDPNWKNEFLKIKLFLEKTIGKGVMAIEHVGSTSIEGLAAKPIIDIDIVIKNYDAFQDVRANLENIGYHHEGNLGIKNREAFRYDEKKMTDFMTHHLYVCPGYSNELKRHIALRNYLRVRWEDVERYSQIKLRAAHSYPTDIDSYIQTKSPFINAIYKKIGL